MYEAWVGALGRVVLASEYEDFTPDKRWGYAESLSCTACEQPAYFIRRARNGRAACFGARPHVEGCELASTLSEDGGSSYLPSEEPRLTADDEFVLRSVRATHTPVRHLLHDPAGDIDDDGRARRFTRHGPGSEAYASIGMEVVLRRLIREPSFRNSRAKLILPGSESRTIRTACIELIEAGPSRRNQWRLYWGTIRYANFDENDGGCWLNLGQAGAPTLHLTAEDLEAVFERYGLEDPEELQGASFLYLGPLRESTRRPGRMYLFADDLDWLAMRMPDEDPI
jgi:hypothetical protein